MKAIRIHETGGIEVLRYEEAEIGRPSKGEVLIAVEAAGLNYIDTYQRRGLYPVSLPFILGLEAAGTVEEVGRDTHDLQPGDRVAFAMHPGAYAEKVLVPAWKVVKLPPRMDSETGAAVMLQGLTAHYLVTSTYPLRAGETALIHAGAGGVGLLLVQMAKLRGARVIATVSTSEKADFVTQMGADEVILYTEQDFLARVRSLTEGKGVEVVYESVGKDTFDRSLDCLRRRGYLVLFGQSSGPVPPLDPQILNAKGSLFLTRPSLGDYVSTREELVSRASELFDWVGTGSLQVHIGATYPLREASQAHSDLESRRTSGKVLLLP
jgi:NADPH:quinone reductase